jgi:hypothetical protein
MGGTALATPIVTQLPGQGEVTATPAPTVDFTTTPGKMTYRQQCQQSDTFPVFDARGDIRGINQDSQIAKELNLDGSGWGTHYHRAWCPGY